MRSTRPLSAGLTVIVIAVVVLVFAVTGGSAKQSQATPAAGHTVSVRQTSLGKTLAGANGHTLYLFRGDRPGVSTVSSAGLAVWPAFSPTAEPHVTGGASSTLLSTVIRPGGSRQLTYNGHPLYYYVGDKHPGDTRGQGLNQFGALWYALSPSGRAVTTRPHTTTTAPNSTQPTGAYSSGY
jgi:predicted lipoprotein with Yx(FWY)xxD motif